MTDEALRPHRLHWWALALLVISVCINYIDRGNLSVAATSISKDLNLNPAQLGRLLEAMFWTYALCQPIAGKLIERWNVNWVFAIGFFAWSLATALTGFVNTVGAIFVLRLILGAGESIAYPSYSQIIATTFPERLRGTANALIDAGSKLGPALGVYIGVRIVAAEGWHFMFIAIGGISLLWLVPWAIIVPKLRARASVPRAVWVPSYAQLLRNRRVWGTILGLFGANYMWYFFLNWLPYYFETERHYTKGQLALVASLPFWTVALSSLLLGIFADLIIRKGKQAGRVRQIFIAIGLLGCCALAFPAVLVKEAWLATTLLTLAAFSMAGFSSNHWALTQTLSGPVAAGKWTGLENCVGNLAGVVASRVTGDLVAATHSFVPAFATACGMTLVGVAGFFLVVGKPDPVQWHEPSRDLQPASPF